MALNAEKNQMNHMLNNFKENINSYVKDNIGILSPPPTSPIPILPNPLTSLNNMKQPIQLQATPSFLMKNEANKKYIPQTAQMKQRIDNMLMNEALNKNTVNSNQSLPQVKEDSKERNLRSDSPIKTIINPQFKGIEHQVELINEKLMNLETRVDKDEKITFNTQSDIRDIKTSLDKNFNKLDLILEKVASKLK
jgi:hypothetical protein